MRKLEILAALLAFVVMSQATGAAQDEQNPVVWSATATGVKQPLQAGERFNVRLSARMAEGWHVYSISQPAGGPVTTTISVPKGQPFTLAGRIQAPKPNTVFDPNFEMKTEFYASRAVFTLPMAVAANAPGGSQNVRVEAYFQSCNDHICLPPTRVKVQAPVLLASVAGPQLPATAGPPDKDSPATPVNTAAPTSSAAVPGQTAPAGSGDISLSAEAASAAAHNSLWKFLLAAAGFALLSLLTPCVFPMIPITVSYFTKQSEQHQGSAIGNASVFSLGIIGTYTVGGFLIARLAGAGGINRFASSPWTNLLITVIFVVFALSLFGAFLIQLPSGFVNKMDSLTRREGGSRIGKNLLMGFTFTLTSFTCTVAFVGTLLVMMTTQNTWFVAVLGMLVFSGVFALPFFVLALVPALMKTLPHSGGWMNSVKVVMGFLEIAAAVKFISNADLVWHWNVFTRSTCLALWVAIGLLITAYILGLFKFENDSTVESIGATRTVLAMFFLAITVWLGNGLLGAPLGELDSFLPPDKARISGTVSASAGQRAGGDLAWIENDYPKALDEAKRENKQVFVDFTGYTCTNCRWMELNMFPRTEVRQELQRYVRVRLYTDGSGPVFEQQKQMQLSRFGTAAQPYYVILNADGNPRPGNPTFPGMTRKVEDFVAFLRG